MKSKIRENVGQRLLIGPKYQKLLTLKVSEDMREYAKRKGFQSGVSGAEWLRKILFPNGWQKELESLRKSQNGKAV